MKKIDVLHEIYHGKMTEEQGWDIFNDIAETNENFADYMGLRTRNEYVAVVCYILSLNEVSKWRYEGWPKKCVRCDGTLNVEHNKWVGLDNIEINGVYMEHVLAHWIC